jgi:membrane protease YdiL (CAAX protease family)
VVLALTFLPNVVFDIITLFEAPVARTVAVGTFPSVEFARQVAGIVFAVVPVWLVIHLARRSGEGVESFGLDTSRLRLDVAWGTVAALVVSAVGLGLYLLAIRLNVNRFVVPVPPLGHWWTIPVLLLGSLQSGLLEEVIVVAYLIRRLEQLGWAPVAALAGSAILRGSYHIYQGWGGVLGNVVLGLFFAWIFLRWRRVWPLITAHFLVDSMAGIAYIAFRGHCVWSLCIR